MVLPANHVWGLNILVPPEVTGLMVFGSAVRTIILMVICLLIR
jgi:hypothetical protein